MNMETMRRAAIEQTRSKCRKSAVEQQQARNKRDGTLGSLHHLFIRSHLDEDLSFDEHQNQVAELQDYVNYHDPRLAIDAFIWMWHAAENGHMDSVIDAVNYVLTQAKNNDFEDCQIQHYQELAEKMVRFKNLITSELVIEDDSKVVDLRC